MLQAILEYAGASHMPSIFLEAASLPVQESEGKLPTRMEGNQLHRYSKVLEDNIGEGHHATRVISSCPRLSWAKPHPLNRTGPPSLFRSQKLLSLNIEAPDMQWFRQATGDLMPDRVGHDGSHFDDWTGFQDSRVFGSDEDTTLWLLLIFSLLCIACYLSYRHCKTRYRLRRRKPRLKKLLAAVSGPRNV